MRILVTALGGDLGQALAKAARLIEPPAFIVGCDMDSQCIGSAFADRFQAVPRADDAAYIGAIKHLCEKEAVDAVVPGSEMEMEVLSRHVAQAMAYPNWRLICQPYDWFMTYRDKLVCYERLQGLLPLALWANGLVHDDVRRLVTQAGFPLVVKPRISSGSKAFFRVDDEQALSVALAEIPDPVVQEYLEDLGEYSIGMFACEGFMDAISFKRKLGPFGCTWDATNQDDDAEVVDYALRIAEVTDLQGSCNVQVRKTPAGVRLLEINARFSSLAAARAACGFEDLRWSMEMAWGVSPPTPNRPYKTIRFRRYLGEVIDEGQGFYGLERWLPHRR